MTRDDRRRRLRDDLDAANSQARAQAPTSGRSGRARANNTRRRKKGGVATLVEQYAATCNPREQRTRPDVADGLTPLPRYAQEIVRDASLATLTLWWRAVR